MQNRPEARPKNFGENIESDLALEFLRVVENAAIESARTMGQGDRPLSDQMATESMRKTMDTVPMRGTIVIGEGERDDAPMLYIGEQVGGNYPDGRDVPQVDIAVDPLEGTNLCATGAPGSITVLAASEKGGLLHAPDCYMDKIVVGPSCKNAIDLDAPVAVYEQFAFASKFGIGGITRCLSVTVCTLAGSAPDLTNSDRVGCQGLHHAWRRFLFERALNCRR